MRPIDADEVMKIIEFENKWLFDAKSNNADTDIAFEAMICGINQIPTLDVKPVIKGKWIEKDGFDGDVYYDCSECGESFCLIDGTPTDNLYNYCPNCGADLI